MKLFLSSLLLCTFFNFTCSAQQGQINIIVKFNYYYLDFEKIDDPHLTTFQFNDILNSNAKKYIDELEVNIPGISNFAITKIFKNLTTKDTISISRQGEKISIPPFWAAFTLTIPDSLSVTRCISILNDSQPLIEYCHYNFPAYLQSTPDDTLYHKQISYNGSSQLPDAGIEVEHAWEIETGKPFIKVGVHDSGIDTLHPDLDVIFGGSYFEPYSNQPLGWGEDLKVHGTPVAGIIAAKRNNLTGIAGIAGGDGHSDSGCSLIDLRLNFYDQNLASYICASVVDAARSVGTYWDYPDTYYEDPDLLQTPGFGIHIGNHSYIIKTDSPIPQNPREDSTWTKYNQCSTLNKNINDSTIAQTPNCLLCREAYLFSYRNGVINVVARGNSSHFTPSTDPTIINNCYPQSFPDNWIISIGASGYDGNTVQQGLNQSAHEEQISYWSMYGGNMDLIAPGSDSIVYTTHVINQNTISNPYMNMNGTSAAAPHVSGVAALLLSHYNKDCYSNRNLAIEDVEYILEHSATNLYSAGYDDTTGWGRLNAYKALQMIENPTKQIVHPDSLISSEIVTIDTISISYWDAFVSDNWGPISGTFPLENHKFYIAERVLIENQYSYAEYMTGSTELIDLWIRESSSNSTEYYQEFYSTYGGPAIGWYPAFDKFENMPFVELFEVDTINFIVKTRGYFYHFIGQYNEIEFPNMILNNTLQVDEWLPVNPSDIIVKMPFSIYIKDLSLTDYYDSPCDSTNLLYDENLGIFEENSENYFTIFPNPSNSELTILSKFGRLSEVEIFDINGKQKLYLTPMTNLVNTNLSHFENGIYFIRCKNEKTTKTIKFIKE
jgi:subtilisin family serine protease